MIHPVISNPKCFPGPSSCFDTHLLPFDKGTLPMHPWRTIPSPPTSLQKKTPLRPLEKGGRPFVPRIALGEKKTPCVGLLSVCPPALCVCSAGLRHLCFSGNTRGVCTLGWWWGPYPNGGAKCSRMHQKVPGRMGELECDSKPRGRWDQSPPQT